MTLINRQGILEKDEGTVAQEVFEVFGALEQYLSKLS
jgi:hypothetical protein